MITGSSFGETVSGCDGREKLGALLRGLDHMSAQGRGHPSYSMQVTRVAPDWPAPSLMHRRRVAGDRITYVGPDVHKAVHVMQEVGPRHWYQGHQPTCRN